MEFGSVTQKLEYEERFDTSGNTSESSNRTPSIESWEYSTGKFDLNNHSWAWQSLDVGFDSVRRCLTHNVRPAFAYITIIVTFILQYSDSKAPGLGDDENDEDVTMLKKGKKRRILFTKVRNHWSNFES